MKNKLTKQEKDSILKAIELGSSCGTDIYFETGVKYEKIIAWMSEDKNMELMHRLSKKPLYKAKKKVMEESNDPRDARWLLTHHKETKTDWSDRTELTGKDGKDLLPKPIIDVT